MLLTTPFSKMCANFHAKFYTVICKSTYFKTLHSKINTALIFKFSFSFTDPNLEFEGWTTIDNDTLSERIDETPTEVIQYQDYGNMGYQVSMRGTQN